MNHTTAIPISAPGIASSAVTRWVSCRPGIVKPAIIRPEQDGADDRADERARRSRPRSGRAARSRSARGRGPSSPRRASPSAAPPVSAVRGLRASDGLGLLHGRHALVLRDVGRGTGGGVAGHRLVDRARLPSEASGAGGLGRLSAPRAAVGRLASASRGRPWRAAPGASEQLRAASEALGERRGVRPRSSSLDIEVALHLLELGRRHGLGLGRRSAGRCGGRARARARRRPSAVGVGRHGALLRLDPAAAGAVLGLALLPVREHRRGDEDRRVRARGDADQQREREVLELGGAGDAAEQQQRQRSASACRTSWPATG